MHSNWIYSISILGLGSTKCLAKNGKKGLLAYGIGGTNISAELHFLYLPILDLPFEIRLYESMIRLAMKRTQSRSNPRTKVNPRRSDSRRICDNQDTTPPEPLVFSLYTKEPLLAGCDTTSKGLEPTTAFSTSFYERNSTIPESLGLHDCRHHSLG